MSSNVLRSKIRKQNVRQLISDVTGKVGGRSPPTLRGRGTPNTVLNCPKPTSQKSRSSAGDMTFLTPWRGVQYILEQDVGSVRCEALGTVRGRVRGSGPDPPGEGARCWEGSGGGQDPHSHPGLHGGTSWVLPGPPTGCSWLQDCSSGPQENSSGRFFFCLRAF